MYGINTKAELTFYSGLKVYSDQVLLGPSVCGKDLFIGIEKLYLGYRLIKSRRCRSSINGLRSMWNSKTIEAGGSALFLLYPSIPTETRGKQFNANAPTTGVFDLITSKNRTCLFFFSLVHSLLSKISKNLVLEHVTISFK